MAAVGGDRISEDSGNAIEQRRLRVGPLPDIEGSLATVTPFTRRPSNRAIVSRSSLPRYAREHTMLMFAHACAALVVTGHGLPWATHKAATPLVLLLRPLAPHDHSSATH
jgi:hypothetical protein